MFFNTTNLQNYALALCIITSLGSAVEDHQVLLLYLSIGFSSVIRKGRETDHEGQQGHWVVIC